MQCILVAFASRVNQKRFMFVLWLRPSSPLCAAVFYQRLLTCRCCLVIDHASAERTLCIVLRSLLRNRSSCESRPSCGHIPGTGTCTQPEHVGHSRRCHPQNPVIKPRVLKRAPCHKQLLWLDIHTVETCSRSLRQPRWSRARQTKRRTPCQFHKLRQLVCALVHSQCHLHPAATTPSTILTHRRRSLGDGTLLCAGAQRVLRCVLRMHGVTDCFDRVKWNSLELL